MNFSPDGTRIVSGSWDDTIRIWDASTGKELATFKLENQERKILWVRFSSDGTRIVAVNDQNSISLWEIETGTRIIPFARHEYYEAEARSQTISPDGRYIAYRLDDKTIKICDALTLTARTTIAWNKDDDISYDCDLSFSPDGRRVAATINSDGSDLGIWDVITGERIAMLDAESGGLKNVSFSPDGRRIASGYGGHVILWDAGTGDKVRMFDMDEWSDAIVSFSPDGTRIAVQSNPNNIKIYDASTGRDLMTLSGHLGRVNSLSFNSQGTRVVTGGDDGTVRLWDAATGTVINTATTILGEFKESVLSLSVSVDGDNSAAGSSDGTIKIWNASTDTKVTTLNGHTSGVTTKCCVQPGIGQATISV